VWLPLVVEPLVTRRPAATVEHYTTFVTGALDLGVLLSATLVGAVLVLRRRVTGYLIACALTGFTALLGPALIGMTVAPLRAGVAMSAADIVIFVVSFLALSGFARGCSSPPCDASQRRTGRSALRRDVWLDREIPQRRSPTRGRRPGGQRSPARVRVRHVEWLDRVPRVGDGEHQPLQQAGESTGERHPYRQDDRCEHGSDVDERHPASPRAASPRDRRDAESEGEPHRSRREGVQQVLRGVEGDPRLPTTARRRDRWPP
jgi:hypothetical protein